MTAHGSPCKGARRHDRTGPSTHGGRHTTTHAEGFTFVEILVSIAVTAVGILCFAGLLKVLGNVEAEDTWKTKALFCAQERMEELKFESVTGKGFAGEGKEDLAEGSYQGMQREWTVGHSTVCEGLLEVTVECAYPWKGSMKSVSLSTLVFPED